ncbi:MAG TPA: hypothetical protein DEA96_17125 [Leptospiraceae bacterium]|nr:hypothetical protein [Leptospiraceae bacterium]
MLSYFIVGSWIGSWKQDSPILLFDGKNLNGEFWIFLSFSRINIAQFSFRCDLPCREGRRFTRVDVIYLHE